MGQKLQALDGIKEADKLIEQIRRRDDSAVAELTAIFLIRSQRPSCEIELFPPVGNRVADFRAREGEDLWTYVEVSQPDWSDATGRARSVLDRIASQVHGIEQTFSLEVFLRREPNEEEVQEVIKNVPEFCKSRGNKKRELPNGLGLLFLNESTPGMVITDNHGEEVRPRIGMARALKGVNQLPRHIAVRMAFADDRAEAFMTSEAKQLPKDSPGLTSSVSRAR